jgi:hypothetical protein
MLASGLAPAETALASPLRSRTVVRDSQPTCRRLDARRGLFIGKHLVQWYLQGTPNGLKVTILLKELLVEGGPYDAGEFLSVTSSQNVTCWDIGPLDPTRGPDMIH